MTWPISQRSPTYLENLRYSDYHPLGLNRPLLHRHNVALEELRLREDSDTGRHSRQLRSYPRAKRRGLLDEWLTEPRGIGFANALPLPPSTNTTVSWSRKLVRSPLGLGTLPCRGVSPVRGASPDRRDPGRNGDL